MTDAPKENDAYNTLPQIACIQSAALALVAIAGLMTAYNLHQHLQMHLILLGQ